MNERLLKELAVQAGYEKDMFGVGHWDMPECKKFAELIIRQCGYYADIFDSLGCPSDMDPTEAKPSDFIKKQLGVSND
jgi:hypothetical protein